MIQLSDKHIEKIKENFLVTIGKRIRAVRKEKAIRQVELGNASRKDRQYIYKIEKGIVTINVSTLKTLLLVFEISFEEFFEDIK
ncbi:helix-turn-helix transcriptional regulator [Olleya sp. YSTF-M6]|uniref:Helix-turn-helix transcriptional regulator n=1 Tax=Olleya sediminilitoris TaxID=2795739 RepID=A0ABS1WIT0_9FLAO|nr:helix-turn-helix transcriptional regulator [Olleya sediminilitoris]MBL7559036.1 helix-turn-helix transcriptional regulator [Olleya sediminilitoris]